MRKAGLWIIVILVLPTIVISANLTTVKAASTGDVSNAINKTVQWLQSTQNPDGGWGVTAGGVSDYSSTLWALVALNGRGASPSVTGKALQYLFPLYKSYLASKDNYSIAWGLLALLQWGYTNSTPEINQGLNAIKGAQKVDGSWGITTDNTAYFIYILFLAGQNSSTACRSAVNYLLSIQRSDGGWLGLLYGESNVTPTGCITEILLRIGVSKDDAHIQNAISYLLAHQDQVSGAWVEVDGYKYLNTNTYALAALSLAGYAFNSSSIQKGLSFLLPYQNPNGSWLAVGGTSNTIVGASMIVWDLNQLLGIGGGPQKMISFNVTYEESRYDVSLTVPESSYQNAISGTGGLAQYYPNVQGSLLEQAYYLYRYVEDPNAFPIQHVLVLHDGQPVQDTSLKGNITNDLLMYCYFLINFADSITLNAYETYAQQWRKTYDDLAFAVAVSDFLKTALYVETLILPIYDAIKGIKSIFDGNTGDQVETIVSFAYEALTSSYDQLAAKYGAQKGDSIYNILEAFGIVSSNDYNPAEICGKLAENPSNVAQALKQIGHDVLNLNLDSDSELIFSDLIAELGSGATGGLLSGTILGLYAYFHSGLTASTAMAIGSSSALASFFGFTVPLILGVLVYTHYVEPMAQAIHRAWESLGFESDFYHNMAQFGLDMANPTLGVFNLTYGRLFAATYGSSEVNGYFYYSLEYYISSHVFPPTSQSDLTTIQTLIGNSLSNAQNFKTLLVRIHTDSEALMSGADPDGSSFDLLLLPSVNVVPVMPSSSNGFALITNSTSNISMECGNYWFTVQDRNWTSNFPNSLYVDDQNGYSYLMLFNPPNGHYIVKTQNQFSTVLMNFKPSGRNITLSTVLNVTTSGLDFDVSGGSASAPTSTDSMMLVGVVGAVALSTVIVVIYIKKRRSFKEP